MTTTTKYTPAEQEQISKTILAQLGGGRFAMMVGAKHLGFEESDGNVSLSFKHMTSNKINHCKITLCDSDTYTMVFTYIRGFNCTVKQTISNVYVEDISKFFRATTGLATIL